MTDSTCKNCGASNGIPCNPHLPRSSCQQQPLVQPNNVTTATTYNTTTNITNNTDVVAHAPSSNVTAVTPSASSKKPVNHCRSCDSGIAGPISVLGKWFRAVACTDLSMNESYDSPVPKTVVACNLKVACPPSDDEDSTLKHVFGHPDIHGEKNQRKNHGPPTGGKPLVSIKQIYRKGPVQTKMCQYMYCKNPTKIVTCISSPYSPSSSPSSVNPLVNEHWSAQEDKSDALADLCGFRVGLMARKFHLITATFVIVH
jgi:hypothetical protein